MKHYLKFIKLLKIKTLTVKKINQTRSLIYLDFIKFLQGANSEQFCGLEFDYLDPISNKYTTMKIESKIGDKYIIKTAEYKREVELSFFWNFSIGNIELFSESIEVTKKFLNDDIQNWKDAVILFFDDQADTYLDEDQFILNNGKKDIYPNYLTKFGLIENEESVWFWHELDCFYLEQFLHFYIDYFYTLKYNY